MKKIVYKLLCLYIFIAFFTACGKKDEEYCTDKNTLKHNQHVMDYFFFKEGTWWVYEEEKTKHYDSIWIEKVIERAWDPVNQKKYCRCGKGKCVKDITIAYVNKEHNESTQEYLYGQVLAVSISDENSLIRETGKINFSTSSYRLEYTKDGDPISPTSLGGVVENMESLKINGKDYKDIMHIYYPKAGVGDWLQEAWYAKNIYLT